jgi:hypothetical protein
MPLRCEHDGSLRTYRFGLSRPRVYVDGNQAVFEIKATSLARAIRAFRVGALFPHAYTDEPVATKTMDEHGHNTEVYLSSGEGAVVKVRVYVKVHE